MCVSLEVEIREILNCFVEEKIGEIEIFEEERVRNVEIRGVELRFVR